MLPLLDAPDQPPFAPFWDAIQHRRLALPRCSVCGRWQWYPELEGTDCAGGVLRWEQVATTGTLHTFTRVHRSFLPGGREHVPYLVGFVDLDGVDDGVHLVVNLDDRHEYAIGDRVAAGFVPLGGRLHPVFAPIAPAVFTPDQRGVDLR
jgi:uncharacterized OB-fold protein